MTTLVAEPIGSLYTVNRESDICELSLSITGLRIVVTTSPNRSFERLRVEYFFEAFLGFRFLDESDLICYWESKVFTHGYHLFNIKAGGWMAQELALPGMLNATHSMESVQEWFICTTNGCVNVLSVPAPLIREFKR